MSECVQQTHRINTSTDTNVIDYSVVLDAGDGQSILGFVCMFLHASAETEKRASGSPRWGTEHACDQI